MNRKFLAMSAVVALAVTLALCATGLADSAIGAEQPLFSKDRASLALGLDYAAYQQVGDEPLPQFKKAWEPCVLGAYVLTPHLTLTGSGAYDVDNRWMRWKVGIRTVLWKGKD